MILVHGYPDSSTPTVAFHDIDSGKVWHRGNRAATVKDAKRYGVDLAQLNTALRSVGWNPVKIQ